MIIQREQAPTVEAGVTIGFPTGVSLKWWMTDRDAFDVGLARNFAAENMSGHADYLLHSRSLTDEYSGIKLPLYAGLGGRIVHFDNGDNAIGPRVPLGVEAILRDVPLSFFGEVAPEVEVGAGSPALTADANVGARIVF